MHVLFIGHAGAVPRLRAISEALRKQAHVKISCYFDADLDRINAERGLPNADILVIGLSRVSRMKDSTEHDVEADIVQRARDVRPPMRCCVVCDEDGNISSHFLVALGSYVQLVVAHEQDATCNVTEVCERAKPLYVPDVIAGADEIAREIRQLRAMA